MPRRFESKVALVSGATSGIGAATAKRLAREGASLACTGRDSVRGERVINDIKSAGVRAIFVRADATDPAQVSDTVSQTINAFGKIDVLFNGAGIQLIRHCSEMTVEEWDSVIDSNLKSAFLFSKFALPWLKKSKGVIINMGSELGLIGAPRYSAYCASKGGVIMLTKALAIECAALGVRVNCISPGATQTAMLEGEVDYYTQNESARFPSRKAAIDFLIDMIPLRRIATPEEIANVIIFVASDEASYMTGAVVPVDAGTTTK